MSGWKNTSYLNSLQVTYLEKLYFKFIWNFSKTNNPLKLHKAILVLPNHLQKY